jgi:hypothetical protein
LESTAASKAIHHTKQKRVKHDQQSSSISQTPPPSKKRRRAGTTESARFQQENVESGGVRNETEGSYADEVLSLSAEKAGNLRVEVEVPEEFDRTEYRTILSSRPSHTNTEIVENDTPWTLSHSALQTSDEVDGQLIEFQSQSSRAQASYTQGEEPSSTQTDSTVKPQSSNELGESIIDQPSTVQFASLFAIADTPSHSGNNHSLEYFTDQESEECSKQVTQHEPPLDSHFSISFQTQLPASLHETPSPLQRSVHFFTSCVSYADLI